MNFDLVSTAELSAGSVIVSITLVWIFARTLTQRIVIATALALWFATVLFIGSTGILGPTRLGTPVLGVAVLLPILALSLLTLRTDAAAAASFKLHSRSWSPSTRSAPSASPSSYSIWPDACPPHSPPPPAGETCSSA